MDKNHSNPDIYLLILIKVSRILLYLKFCPWTVWRAKIQLMDFLRCLGAGNLSIGVQMDELTPSWTAGAAKEGRSLVRQKSILLCFINSQLDWDSPNSCQEQNNHRFSIKSRISSREVLIPGLCRSCNKNVAQKLRVCVYDSASANHSFKYSLMYNIQSWFSKTAVMSLCTISGKKETAHLMCVCIPGVHINTRFLCRIPYSEL